jgi:hypothetical protein
MGIFGKMDCHESCRDKNTLPYGGVFYAAGGEFVWF